MKFKFLLLFLSFTPALLSQEKFSKEFSFIADNDLYVSLEKDQYYINGMFFKYRFLSNELTGLEKKIYTVEVGHQMYTPHRPDLVIKTSHDRPFAAHLYGALGMTRTYQNESMIHHQLMVGIVGPAALGKTLQGFIHDIYGFNEPVGWKYQIQHTLSANLNSTYFSKIKTDASHRCDLNFMGKLRLGTIHNEAGFGLLGRIGFKKLQPNTNSIAFNTHLNNSKTNFKREVESFIYYKPSFTYVFYDATMQGSLFNNDSPVTFDPKPIRFDIETRLLVYRK